MRILQRYVIQEIFAPTAVSLAFFTVLLLLRHFFTLAEVLLNASVGIGLLLELSTIIIVTLFSLTIPMASLLGVLIGIGRMTAENEILAIRVAGISLVPVFLPVFVGAGLLSCVLAWGNRDVFPTLMARIQSQQQRIQFELLTSLKPGTWYADLSPKGSNLSLYFDETGPKKSDDGEFVLRMKRIAIQVSGDMAKAPGSSDEKEKKKDKKEPKEVDRTPEEVAAQEAEKQKNKKKEEEAFIFAQAGTITGDLATGALTVELLNGTMTPINSGKKDESMTLSFARMTKVIKPEVDEDAGETDPRRMTMAEISKVIDNPPKTTITFKDGKKTKMRDDWVEYFAVRTELYTRNSFPFSVLAFVLLAVPLAIEIRPRAKSVSFLIAIALITVYYGMSAWSNAVGASGSDWAWLAAASPNILIGGIGIALFWRTQRVV